MSTLLFLLLPVIVVLTIIALVKPALLFPGKWVPGRGLIAIMGLVLFIFVAVAAGSLAPQSEYSLMTEGQRLMQQEKYAEAISVLSQIENSDSLKTQANEMISVADSVMKLTPAEKDSIEAALQAKAEEEAAEMKRKLDVAAINHVIDYAKDFELRDDLMSSKEAILFYADDIESRAATTREFLESEDPELQKLAKQASSEMTKMQAKVFPKLRQAYVDAVRQPLWLENISISASGSRKDKITFTGGTFAANRNVSDFQTALSSTFHKLRFKRINYKWYEYDDEYTYYTLESKKDSEL